MDQSDVTVILANGEFPTARRPLEILGAAARIVCCDGAAAACVSHGFEPTVVIGDLDSFPSDLRHALSDRLVHVTEQETNDLSKAFRHCLANGWERVVILGATGRREDHTLGNISLLGDFARRIPSVRMVTDYGEFEALTRSAVLPSVCGEQISIFALDSGTRLHSRGLKYPLDGLTPDRWWQATLNEALGESFELMFPEGHAVLVYRAY